MLWLAVGGGVLAARPLVVVSDIDDTIKDTRLRLFGTPLPNPLALLELVHDSRPVPGMAGVYRGWERNAHARFEYVSAAPVSWDRRIESWLDRGGFPKGAGELRGPGSPPALREYKVWRIEKLIAVHPCARFVLVGDSGQWDREAYGEVARHHRQVMKILIRHVTCEAKDSARYRCAFGGVARSRWRTFSRADEIARLRL